jgi:universal stress protein E
MMNSGLRCVLVVVDAASGSRVAIEKAAAVAAAAGARLRLFSCSHDPRLTARLFLSPDSLSAARAAELRQRRARLEELAAPLRERGLEVDVEVAWDAPLHAGILTEVSLARPDLVVKEAAWQESLMRRLFTHTDWRLMQACPVPVLLTHQAPWSSPRRIAAAVDPGHPGDPAAVLDHAILTQAERFAGWLGASLAVVHAYLPMDRAMLGAAAAGMPLSPPEGIAGLDMRSAAAAAVRSVLDGHALPQDAVHLLEGAAIDVVPAWCQSHGTDVLVVGVVSRSRLAETVIGSTAERLLERVPSDLLAVRGPPR